MWIAMKYGCLALLAAFWFTSIKAQPVQYDSALIREIYSLGDSATASGMINDPAYKDADRKPFEVGDIVITGNNRTKDYIILRELLFKTGDSVNLSELVQAFELSRQQLMNTKMFNEVVIALKNFYGHIVNINIQVRERWYIFPIPYLKPMDRNLTEWAKQGYSANRLNYGIKFTHYNFSGRNDKLRLWLVTGYSKQFQFQYDQPNADRSLKHGYKIGFNYSHNREVNYLTSHNQQVFNDSFSSKRLNAFVEYDYRPGLRTFHAVRIGYTRQEVDPKVIELNPKYFNSGLGTNKISYPEISYSVSHFNVDYIPYPLTGWMGEAGLTRRGLNEKTGMWQLNGKFNKNWPLAKRTFYSMNVNGTLRLPFDQPFINSQMFGYGDFYLRGLEKYVVDGVAGLLVRNTLRRQILKFSIPTPLNPKTHSRIPFSFYAKTYADVGYSYNKNFQGNTLVNKMLYTAGLGIDMVTFYDVIVRFDYSFNQLGQNGLFLHIKNDF